MRKYFNILILISVYLWTFTSHAKLKVLTTTSNLKSLVEVIGGEKIDVESFGIGTQDPHYLKAKPSYILKASKADLLVSIGLDLEVGWLPLVIRGARNPKLKTGNVGSFIAGNYIETLDKPTAVISRADGDVHPSGNPHILLDPVKALKVGLNLKNKLKLLDAENALDYERNFQLFSTQLNSKLQGWKRRVQVGKKVITYHKTLTYFYHRFGIRNLSFLEPKPGIPPSAGHVLTVIQKAKREGIKLILVENYYDSSVAKRVAKEVGGMKIDIVPVAVGGEPNILNLSDLYERLVVSVEQR